MVSLLVLIIIDYQRKWLKSDQEILFEIDDLCFQSLFYSCKSLTRVKCRH